MDEDAARAIFSDALATHAHGFETFFVARLLRLEFSYPNGKCHVRFPVADFLFNPQGILHGGVIATVLDISMGHLLKREYGVGGTTLEMKVQYFRSVKETVCRCKAQFLQRGRNVAFLESRLYEESVRLVAFATATWMLPKLAGP